MLVHASVATVPAWAPVGQYAEWYRAHVDGDVSDVLWHPSPMAETLAYHRDRWAHVEHYDDFVEFLSFDRFDPDEWAGLALEAGMGYVVMNAKHHDGLCWWDAPNSDFTVLDHGPKRDVLAELAAACQRADLTLGAAYSLLDWHDPSYPSETYVSDTVHPQVLDLVSRFGIGLLWGNGHWGGGQGHWRSDALVAAARVHQPDLLINDRWWASGPSVETFEYRMPAGIVDTPWEMRTGLGGSIAYNRAEGPQHLMSSEDIISLLTEVVAKGGHLVIGVSPDATGAIPTQLAEPLRGAGAWINRHRDLIDRGTPWGVWGNSAHRYLVLDDILHTVVLDATAPFAELTPSAGQVTAVLDPDGQPLRFDQSDRGLTVEGHLPDLATVYRIEIDEPPAAPVELFPSAEPQPFDLASEIAEAQPGDIVQLGDGVYLGPARIPDGVTLRGLGPRRTVLDGRESTAITLGAASRVEYCGLRGGGPPIAWLPRTVATIVGDHALVLGCEAEGHIGITGSDARIVSTTANGVAVDGTERAQIARSTFIGNNWGTAISITGGSGHTVESCEFDRLLCAVHLTDTIGAQVRGNRIHARWCGIQLSDTEATLVVGNAIEATMRAVDVDGGTQAQMAGNSVSDGDSGCVVQRGATDTEVSGNRWERCRIGVLVWDAGPVHHRDNAAVDLDDPDGAYISGP